MNRVGFNFIKTKWRLFVNAHPLTRGAITYAVLWPFGSLVQQTIEGRNYTNYDWKQCVRFSIFGSLWVAPTLYGWVRLSTAMWPQMSLRIALMKAITEQFSYGPFACATFFMGMSLLELKTFEGAVEETRKKFWPTYYVGVCFWPIIQTINFSVIPEHNRLVFVSICSVMWTIFLAYMNRKTMNAPHSES
ncbi:mpv17-like protein [Teleopsis dalmanni]|uniref:mpv17-like protein n=1 Tax=Teleopsis dalmanni TaxID=139649 RepID=UPI0018CD7126|nr:mpv17-like protein [Teleopsis dalmanni]XP_037938384.1 mpv17-like protein [Teleopsis dalmanni]